MKKNIIMGAVAAVVIIVAACIIGFSIYNDYKEKNTPSDVVMPLSEYYGISGEDVMVIIDEKVYDKKALWREDMVYFDLDTVVSMYDHRFFWVENENTLFYAPPDTVYAFKPGENDYLLNRSAVSSSVPMVQIRDGVVYVSIKLLEQYCGITYKLYDEPHRILITYSDEAYLAAVATEDTQIRVSQDIKADILKEVKTGDVLRFIDGGGIREKGFIKVMSEDGVRGYIKEASMETGNYVDPEFVGKAPTTYSHSRLNKKVYLGWQLLYTKENTGFLNEALALAPEMNVISPTWFYMCDTEGNLIDYANRDYIETAHEKGLQVWALYKNDTIEGKFSCTEDSHKVLSSTETRLKLVDNIVNAAVEYGFDGINIDFELLKKDSGVYFIQFLRELSI
ncbi:MAG: hypothetical protein J6Y89_03320, partial [Lachnospiraceae bacterium]|nr:hypothetical protein [Lachnospiraceae bacterium]